MLCVRDDKLLHPFKLELMKCILTQNMPYNLPYLLFSSFEFCYHNNYLGYGLLLTSIFRHLGIDDHTHHTQLVHKHNVTSNHPS